MVNVSVNDSSFSIVEKDYSNVCENLKKRVIRILYLKDSLINKEIQEYDMKSYISALIWDMYGAYVLFENYKFLNAICELEGIKENIFNNFVRKKVLDLANYVSTIPTKKE